MNAVQNQYGKIPILLQAVPFEIQRDICHISPLEQEKVALFRRNHKAMLLLHY